MIEKMSTEQGWICAYTMKRIIKRNREIMAHIEHILPRSVHPNKSVVWDNMVACVPRPGEDCEYGAKLKDNYDPEERPFLKPTMAAIHQQFQYHVNGRVKGLTPGADACVSEQVLNLNHTELVNDRKAKIRAALAQRPTATAARRRAAQLRVFDSHGRLEPYCEAVAQVLESYAYKQEERAKRLSGRARS
jgi:uncharacterized protein (TIGR02646 family)